MTQQEQDVINALADRYYNVIEATPSTIWFDHTPQAVKTMAENLTYEEAAATRMELIYKRRNLDIGYFIVNKKTGALEWK